MNKEVGETIRALRKAMKISQEKLADRIDSHQVYISEIEKGEKLPSLATLYKIAKSFGMTLTQLVAMIEAKIADTDGEQGRTN